MCLIPVRCFSCNTIIGDKWNKYQSHLNNGITQNNALVAIGLRRYCCKRMLLGYVELIDKLILYSKNNYKYSNENPITN